MLKPLAKWVAQQTLGRLPRPASRLTGRLAIEGGTPVRDVRLRPWRKDQNSRMSEWWGGGRAALRGVFRSGVEGLPQPLAREFAKRWAEYCGCKHALLLPHGTDALRLALAATLDHDGLDYGGEVIVPNLSFIASATAPLDRRLGVCFVDVQEDTLLLDPAKVEEAIVPGRTRAILPVHLFGQPCDMTALEAIAQKHGLKIVEDAAQAHGASWQGRATGSLGDAAGFSFQSHKNLNCGEGGALTTNDDAIFERAYMLHNAGRALKDGGRWEHVTLGWNCRPTEYQAALLLHRLRDFDDRQERRRANFHRLRSMLDEVPCVVPQAVPDGVGRHGVHMLVLRYKAELCGGLSIEDFLKAAGAEGAPTYRGYSVTMTEQPAIGSLLNKRPEYVRVRPTPVADQAVRELIYIPHEALLGEPGDMEDIAAALAKVQRRHHS